MARSWSSGMCSWPSEFVTPCPTISSPRLLRRSASRQRERRGVPGAGVDRQRRPRIAVDVRCPVTEQRLACAEPIAAGLEPGFLAGPQAEELAGAPLRGERAEPGDLAGREEARGDRLPVDALLDPLEVHSDAPLPGERKERPSPGVRDAELEAARGGTGDRKSTRLNS